MKNGRNTLQAFMVLKLRKFLEFFIANTEIDKLILIIL